MRSWHLFINFWLCWVSIAGQAFLWLWFGDFSLQWLLLLWSTDSSGPRLQELQHTGSKHSLVACGIFPDPGLNLCLLHWQAGSTTEPSGKPRHLFLTSPSGEFPGGLVVRVQRFHCRGSSLPPVHSLVRELRSRKPRVVTRVPLAAEFRIGWRQG